MPTVVLSISKDFNNWLKACGGHERGDRQRFIVATLKMFKNGFIIKDGSVRKVTTTDIRQNIDVLRAQAEAEARNRDEKEFSEQENSIYFTPVDVLSEMKETLKRMGLSEDSRDTLKAMREEQVKLSSVIPSPKTSSISPYSAPPPPLLEEQT